MWLLEKNRCIFVREMIWTGGREILDRKGRGPWQGFLPQTWTRSPKWEYAFLFSFLNVTFSKTTLACQSPDLVPIKTPSFAGRGAEWSSKKGEKRSSSQTLEKSSLTLEEWPQSRGWLFSHSIPLPDPLPAEIHFHHSIKSFIFTTLQFVFTTSFLLDTGKGPACGCRRLSQWLSTELFNT